MPTHSLAPTPYGVTHIQQTPFRHNAAQDKVIGTTPLHALLDFPGNFSSSCRTSRPADTPLWAQQTEQPHGYQNEASLFIPVSLQPGKPECRAHPTEAHRLQYAEEDQTASGDPPAD